MFVAVVTHSPQATLVRQVLEESLKDCDTNEIAIRGSDNSWKKVHGVTGEGKKYSGLFPKCVCMQRECVSEFSCA